MKIHTLEVKRLLCPMPVIRLGELIKKIADGDEIEMIATDRGVLHDIPAWCRVHGHKIISMAQNESEIIICVKKIKVK